MGFLYKSGRVRSFILIFLTLLALVVCIPVGNHFISLINNGISKVLEDIQKETGLKISYQSMSPSLMKNVSIRQIEISSDEGNLLSIQNVKAGIKISELFKKNLQEGITYVLIDGVNIELSKFLLYIQKIKKNSQDENEVLQLQMEKYIPRNVKLKNININYDQNNFLAVLNVKKINVDNNPKKNIMELQIDSEIDAKISSSIQMLNQKFSCQLNVNGDFSRQIDEAHFVIRISNLTNGIYKIGKLNFQATLEDNKFDIHTIQVINPISVGVKYDLQNNVINAQLKTEKLKPFEIILSKSNQKKISKFKNISFDTDTIVNCDLSNKTLMFLSDSNILVPDNVFAGGLDAGFSVYGNQNEFEVTKLYLNGENCIANGSLNYSYENMQLSGMFDLPYFKMKNGKVITTEVYFDALEKGFKAFSPQIFVDNHALTALSLSMLPGKDSFDFRFEASDYSHSDDSEPGVIQIDGSYLPKSNYIQTSVLFNTIYLDTIVEFVQQFLSQDKVYNFNTIKKNVSPYVISGDFYVSSDFKTISYNVPYILLANTQKENQVIMLSVNGNEQSFQMNNLSVVYGKVAFEASGTFDRNEDFSDMFFTLELTSSSIPYHFSGSIMPGILTLSGDYDTQLEVSFEKDRINGFINFNNLPINFSKNTTVFSTNTQFFYDSLNGPEIRLHQFEVEIPNVNYSTSPKITLSGNITKYGAQFDSIAYSDLYSSLQGDADVTVNINNSILDSIGARINVKNPFSQENIFFDGVISNPEQIKLTKENILKNLYLNLQLELNSFGLNRFGFLQNENNKLSASFYASGILENPYISLNVSDSSILIANSFLKVSGNAILEDEILSVNDFSINYDVLNISDIQAKCSLRDITLAAEGKMLVNVGEKTLQSPMKLKLSNAIVPHDSRIPESFFVNLELPEFSGSMIKTKFPLSLSFSYSDKYFLISSSQNAGINGIFDLNNKLLDLTVNNGSFISFGLGGITSANNTSLSLYDINIDLAKLFSYLNYDNILSVENGIINGDIMISNSLDNPDFSGSIRIPKPIFRLPFLTNHKLTTDELVLNFNQNEIEFEKTVLNNKNNQKVEVEFDFMLNKWIVDRIEGSVKTQNPNLFPIKITTPLFVLQGNVFTDLKLSFEENIFDISGTIFGEDIDLNSSVSSFTGIPQNQLNELQNNSESIQVQTNLDIKLGTHASISFDPILRCVFVPNTSFSLIYNPDNEQLSVDGELKVRSGDVSYLNRNFYIKSGAIKFNPEELSNPIVTFRAETREKDFKGQTVKIIMSVENQYLDKMEPRFSSEPAKSENDILTMLGQIVVADSNKATDFLFAASDYALQSTVMRSMENKLRDLLNFDIFSIRTNILQNTLGMGMSGDLSKNNISIGNFLDNSTVYVGRYLGSSLYIDAMLHVSFDNTNTSDIFSVRKTNFQPEFGIELEGPLSNVPIKINSGTEFLFSGPNIRINMAPDINAMINGRFEPATSLTLTWKLTF